MDTKHRYGLEKLEWQQFEELSFKCLQLDIAHGLTFIEGGRDKGRDFIFTGKTNFWGDEKQEYKFLFQAKHKSKQNSFASLNKDLKTEIQKVFILNKLDYNFYCLVTNLSLTGNQYDDLRNTFNSFVTENNLSNNIRFEVYSYRNVESCIDKHSFIKWLFPTIVSTVDFKLLIEDIIQKDSKNIAHGWVSVFEKNKENFVYTNIFEEAILKLNQNNILLLSGPSKSGKTFNAEMLLFNYFCEKSFVPYKIDRIEEFDRFYDSSKSQIFLFDDAFGRYNIDLQKADSFDRKIEYLFELIDEKHKCIFTSREYIYKAFLDYSDNDKEKIITKINVEVNNLTIGEKESIFLRYYKSLSDNFISDDVLFSILNHKNFSPETIRAYFVNNKSFDLDIFIKHLESPDEYLEKDFKNLIEERKIVLLSILFSLKGTDSSIYYSYDKICKDLNKSDLISINDILYQLDGSLLKSNDKEYVFYHPSMFEFFVRYISKDVSIYRKLLFSNFNIKFLDVIKFLPDANIGNSDIKDKIKINENDLELLIVGFKRLINNPEMSMIELNSLIGWIGNPDVLFGLKMQFENKYTKLKDEINLLLMNLDLSRFINQDTYHIGNFFRIIRYYYHEIEIEKKYFSKLIEIHKEKNDYWYLVFRILPLLDDNFIFNEITKKWLNNFYLELRDEINSLGSELYGKAYPTFEELEKYNKLKEEKRFKEAQLMKMKNRADFKQKTNKNWYPRYSLVKEKMKVLKACYPHGYKIYDLLIINFSHLKALEENQLNRYLFLKEKKWW